MSEPTLNDLVTIEAEILAHVQASLGDLATLPDEVVAVYKELGRAFLLASSSLTDEQVYGFMFLLSSLGHQALLGSLDTMRGHPTDSTTHTRKSIEAAAFCMEMLVDADSAKRWLEAGKSKGAMEKYKSRFPAFKVVERCVTPKSQQLTDTYEHYCLTVHPGLASVSRQAALSDTATFEFNHVEVASEDDYDNLKAQYLLAITTHMQIIEVLTEALEEQKFPLAANHHVAFGKLQSKLQNANLEFSTEMLKKGKGMPPKDNKK